MPAAMSLLESSCRHHVGAGILPASENTTVSAGALARQPAGTHASTQKMVGLGVRPHRRGSRGHAGTPAGIQKDGPRRHRSVVLELEHVGLHLLEPRSFPWRQGVEIHLHDVHPGHHACKRHFFRLCLALAASISSILACFSASSSNILACFSASSSSLLLSPVEKGSNVKHISAGLNFSRH